MTKMKDKVSVYSGRGLVKYRLLPAIMSKEAAAV